MARKSAPNQFSPEEPGSIASRPTPTVPMPAVRSDAAMRSDACFDDAEEATRIMGVEQLEAQRALLEIAEAGEPLSQAELEATQNSNAAADQDNSLAEAPQSSSRPGYGSVERSAVQRVRRPRSRLRAAVSLLFFTLLFIGASALLVYEAYVVLVPHSPVLKSLIASVRKF